MSSENGLVDITVEVIHAKYEFVGFNFPFSWSPTIIHKNKEIFTEESTKSFEGIISPNHDGGVP